MSEVIIIGLLVNWLLLYHELGLGAFLSVLLTIGYTYYVQEKKSEINRKWWLKTGIIIAMSLVFILRDMMVFKVLTFISLPFVFALFYVDFGDSILLKNLGAINIVVFRPFMKFHCWLADLIKRVFRGSDKAKHITLGVIITIPFLVVVLPLLISSDLIFQSITLEFFESFEISMNLVGRILFFLVFVSYIYGQNLYEKKATGIGYVASLRENPSSTVNGEAIDKDDDGKYNKDQSEIDESKESGKSIMMKTFLAMINVVYGLFVYIQIKFLFLNLGVLPEDLTYAKYAREGFFQLLTVAIMNVLVIIFIEWWKNSDGGILKNLENLTLLFTIVMSVSAFYRMALYEDSYGYTSIRLLVFMFLIFLMIFMVLLIAYIFTNKKLILNVIAIFMVVYYIGSSWFNVDGFVARENVKRYEEEGKVDIGYLYELSADSDKVVLPFLDKNPTLLENYNNDFLGFGRTLNDSEIDDFRDWNMQKKFKKQKTTKVRK